MVGPLCVTYVALKLKSLEIPGLNKGFFVKKIEKAL